MICSTPRENLCRHACCKNANYPAPAPTNPEQYFIEGE